VRRSSGSIPTSAAWVEASTGCGRYERTSTYDFEVSIPHDVEHAGLSAFALEDGLVYHTYSCYSRGLEAFNSAYQLLDRAPRAATRTSCRCRSPGFGATTSTKTGYPRFAAQGGDWGGYVVGRLAHAHWDKLLASI
jgi:hypothetical protein